MSRKAPVLVLRADATPHIGTGHVTRCIALAEAWRASGGTAVIIGRIVIDWLSAAASEAGIQVRQLNENEAIKGNAETVLEAIAELQAQWVVIDGYRFDSSYQRLLTGARAQLGVVDDLGDLGPYHARLIVNQGLHGGGYRYESSDPLVQVLTGPRWALLRSAFWTPTAARLTSRVERVLVTLGGGETSTRVATLARSLEGLGVEVVVPGRDGALQSLMREADIAVSAAGTTAWELLSFGVPTILVAIADNQVPSARDLAKAGYVLRADPSRLDSEVPDLVERLIDDESARAHLARHGPALVDGNGALRVAQIMRGDELWLRSITQVGVDEPTARFDLSGTLATAGAKPLSFIAVDAENRDVATVTLEAPEGPMAVSPMGGLTEGGLQVVGRKIEMLARNRVAFELERERRQKRAV